MQRLASAFFSIYFLCTALLGHGTQRFELLRPDDSVLVGYFDPPSGVETFALAIGIQGSPSESVWDLHQQFVKEVTGLKMGLITIEKQGIYGPDCMDETEYNKTNCRPHRIKDYLWFMERLREGLIPGWDGQIALLGGSEGGTIVASLAHRVPNLIAAIIFSSGGGIPCVEEMKLMAARYTKNEGYSPEDARDFLDFLNAKFEEIYRDPAPHKKLLDYTYKWWAHHLQSHTIDDMLKIECPLYYSHSVDDDRVPIESADIAAEMFEKLGKKNLTYRRIMGYGHDIRKSCDDLIEDACAWLGEVLEEQKEKRQDVHHILPLEGRQDSNDLEIKFNLDGETLEGQIAAGA